jgi:hypothetical protein
MHTFVFNRKQDISGISGTGIIAQGCEFESGITLLCWLGSTPSIVLHDSFQNILDIHGHNGATEIVNAELNFQELIDKVYVMVSDMHGTQPNRTFVLDRTSQGIVATGCEFPNGTVLLHWLGTKSSIILYDSIRGVETVQCGNGLTKIVYQDVNMIESITKAFGMVSKVIKSNRKL